MSMTVKKPVILIVDDEKSIRDLAREWFQSAGYPVETAGNAEKAVRVIHQRANERVVAYIDHDLPGGFTGLDLIRYIRQNARYHVVMHFWTGRPEKELRLAALQEGALHAYRKDLHGMLDWEDLVMHAETESAWVMVQEATRDSLTGLLRRPVFEEMVLGQLASARTKSERHGTNHEREIRLELRPEIFSLLCIDLDHFKEVNDTYGHMTGDRALQAVSQIIRDHVRASDFPCRWGGDELLVWLPDLDEEQARAKALELQNRVSSSPVEAGPGVEVPLSISVGIAHRGRDGLALDASPRESFDRLIEQADADLYQAKARRVG